MKAEEFFKSPAYKCCDFKINLVKNMLVSNTAELERNKYSKHFRDERETIVAELIRLEKER